MKTRTIILLVLAIFASGCVQKTTIPLAARPGDKVVVGLGGVHRNVQSSFNLKASDLTVSITDQSGNTYPVAVFQTFRAYPDYSSFLTTQALQSGMGMDIVPYDGGWFAVVKLSDANDSPLPLAEGDATLSVTSPVLDNTMIGYEGNLSAVRMEILPPYPEGETQDGAYTSQFENYAPNPARTAVRIVEDDLSGFGVLGGASVVVNVSNLPQDVKPLGFPVSHNPWIQVGSQFIDSGGGTGQIRAYILNPHGFTSTQALQNALFEDLELQIVPVGLANFPDPTVYTLDTANSYVFDLNGNPVTGVTLEWVNLAN